jgi:hypothetical protein
VTRAWASVLFPYEAKHAGPLRRAAGGQDSGAKVVSGSSIHRWEVAHGPAREGMAPAAEVITGAYFLNSGLAKRGADDATASQLHGFAWGTYPFLGKLDAKRFTGLLSTAEIAIGAALVVPVVPAWLAGAGLTVFALGTSACTCGHPACAKRVPFVPLSRAFPWPRTPGWSASGSP